MFDISLENLYVEIAAHTRVRGRRTSWFVHCIYVFNHFPDIPWLNQTLVIKVEWLWKSLDSFVICFCWLFWTWPCTTFNSISIILNLLTKRKIALIYSVTICQQKYTKDCARSGSFQHKLPLFSTLMFASFPNQSPFLTMIKQNMLNVLSCFNSFVPLFSQCLLFFFTAVSHFNNFLLHSSDELTLFLPFKL